ncbi:MAG TPA: hypothetical protein PKN45_08120 [Candidatus Limiplasma sp.]|nr:hypothetical protein [Candidatus Limiplasma sp.]
MSETLCPRCGKALNPETGASFCPFCGAALSTPEPEDEAVQALLKQAAAQSDPVKRHDLLIRAQEQYPRSLAVAEELLLLGRLYQRNPRKLDFSVIKSWLLNLYLDPRPFTEEQQAAMRNELFHHPDLDRCLALCGDETVFLNRYLTRMSAQFIDLFLKGNSQYMHRYFGFGLESRAAKYLAEPSARILAAISADTGLTPEQRGLLKRAFFAAFRQQLGEDTQWLQQAMAERNVTLDS